VPKLPGFAWKAGESQSGRRTREPRICREYRRGARITCTACHAEGRGFESLQPLSDQALQSPRTLPRRSFGPLWLAWRRTPARRAPLGRPGQRGSSRAALRRTAHSAERAGARKTSPGESREPCDGPGLGAAPELRTRAPGHSRRRPPGAGNSPRRAREAIADIRAIVESRPSARWAAQPPADSLILSSHLPRRCPRLEALDTKAPVKIHKRF